MIARDYQRPDLHLHSTFSDGTDRPAALLAMLRAKGIDCFSLTDHDTLQGCEEIISNLHSGDPAFIRGVEFSCEDADGEYHILAYAYDPFCPSLNELVEKGHRLRLEKAEDRFRFLRERCGFSFSEEEEQSLLSLKNPGKPHFVSLLLRKGLVGDKEEGFALLRKFPEKANVSPEMVIDAILRAKGIPTLAHGILSDGSHLLSEEQITRRVYRLKDAGLRGLECFYSTYTPEQQAIMLSLAMNHDLLITAGSDYHGANKSIEIGKTHLLDSEILRPFLDAVSDRIIIKE